MTVTYGNPLTRLQVAPPSVPVRTPTSVPRYIVPPEMTNDDAGTSGRLPLASVQLAPPSVVFQRWPSPAPGPSVKRRLKPLTTRYAVLPVGSDGAMVTP